MFLRKVMSHFGLCVVSLLLLYSQVFGVVSARITPIDKSRTYYTAAAGDLDGDGVDEIVGGAFDDSLVVTNAEGKILWTVALQGLPYSIALGDVDGDKKKEIAVTVMDKEGSVKLLGYRKALLWSYSSDLPFLSVAM
ncbi:MAG: VCBS repeat-containing protein, partial [Deltaproteobacteria bacterium]|nr:VCBS repeat-containing protein [Deltaproteobacteria bacterium]